MTTADDAEPLGLPRLIAVETDADSGAPLRLRRHGRTLAVLSVQEAWRIDDEWWRQPIARHYYQIECSGGVLITIFRDGITQTWWEQRA